MPADGVWHGVRQQHDPGWRSLRVRAYVRGLVAEILDRVIDPGRLMHLDGVPDGYWVVLALADLEAARNFASGHRLFEEGEL